MKDRVFYTPIYSPDDNGWYCEVFKRNGKTVTNTELHDTKEEAINAVKNEYPNARRITIPGAES